MRACACVRVSVRVRWCVCAYVGVCAHVHACVRACAHWCVYVFWWGNYAYSSTGTGDEGSFGIVRQLIELLSRSHALAWVVFL